jgi:hypothetical protein
VQDHRTGEESGTTHQHGLGFENLLGKQVDDLLQRVDNQLGRQPPERLLMFLGDFGGMPRILEKNPDFVDLDVTNQFRRRDASKNKG